MAGIKHIKTRPMARLLLLVLLAAALTADSASADKVDIDSFTSSSIKTYGYKIINSYPHDPNAFTQGLEYDDGLLYEGTGGYGQSSLRRVDIQTGRVVDIVHLEDEFFAEGIAIWKDRIIQLTWRSYQGFVWDKENLTQTGSFSYRREGWGITSDASRLIMSDGSDALYFLDPSDYSLQGSIRVTADGEPVKGLNELEYINGMIYANLWPSTWIAIISPDTGEVTGRIDLSGIMDEGGILKRWVDVLNGIAYDPSEDRLFVTGKLWPSLFEIELVEDTKEESNQQ
ncbi:glutaminyl-peptide cyclotransferase [Methanothrix soehngenii]|jgi:glutamine cyclotransferase|uniref:glutaminyl-peptide cyclotransferase n=1 Tax=Methanothrix soehngenii TaxID=2223 RepID=UPI00300C5FCD